jgi:tetratricopeptide (TPR) repeat protein
MPLNLRLPLNWRTPLLLCLAISLPLSTPRGLAQQEPSNGVDQAFRYLYNFEFQQAHRVLDTFEREHPEDPMGAATRSAVYLFSELQRLDLLASEFFQDRGDRIQSRKLSPDPKLREKLFETTQRARDVANKVLTDKPDNLEALFALSTAAGIESDYLFFVEKKRLGSLKLHKESHGYCQRLLELDPDYPDAYLTSGFYEYLVGDLPFFLRWFIRFDGVEGDKEKGIERLQFVSNNARYCAGFAKVLLAAVYLREDRPGDSVRMLHELTRDYPRNPLFPREIRQICEKHKLPLPTSIAAEDNAAHPAGSHSTNP